MLVIGCLTLHVVEACSQNTVFTPRVIIKIDFRTQFYKTVLKKSHSGTGVEVGKVFILILNIF